MQFIDSFGLHVFVYNSNSSGAIKYKSITIQFKYYDRTSFREFLIVTFVDDLRINYVEFNILVNPSNTVIKRNYIVYFFF